MSEISIVERYATLFYTSMPHHRVMLYLKHRRNIPLLYLLSLLRSIKKYFIAINYECKNDKILLHLIAIAKGIIKDNNNIDAFIQIFNIVQSFTEIRSEKTATQKTFIERLLRLFKWNQDTT